MATYFVDSAAAGAGTGADWANAYTTLAAALAVATSADTIYVANTHNASQTTAKTLTCPTTPGLRILCVTPNGASGNSGLATGAIEAVGAVNAGLSVAGYAYIYGISILGATNNSTASSITLGGGFSASHLVMESCLFEIRNTNNAVGFFIGQGPSTANDENSIYLVNCTFKFGATTQGIFPKGGRLHFVNTGFDSAGSAPTTLLGGSSSAPGSILWEASDLSGETFTNIASAAWNSSYDVTFRNCKFGSSPTLTTGTHSGPGGLVLRVHNCDSGDTQYNFSTVTYAGSVVDETTIVRSGGGVQSYRMDSSANVKFPYLPLAVEGAIYNSAVGSPLTLTVEYVADENVAAGQGSGTSNAFTNAELWLEVQHQGTSGFPQGVVDIDDRAADVLATPADQASSSVTWTTTGMTTPKKGKLECTFTPQEIGYVHYKVCLAAASKIVYVDVLGASLA